MKLKTFGLITAALLGGALVPAGFARDGEGDARARFERHDGRPGFAPGPRRQAAAAILRRGAAPGRLIERLDEDGDSGLSFEEFNARRLEAADRGFERLDADANGLLDGAELERPERPQRPARPQRRGRAERPQRPERPERPEIDRELVIACVRGIVADYDPPPVIPEDRLAYMDIDGDGVVDGREWSAAMEQRQRHLFNRLDVDGDNVISARDLASFGEQEINLRRVVRACVDEQLNG